MLIKKKDLYYPSFKIKERAWIKNKEIYQKALKNPLKFWEERAQELFWFKKWTKVFEHKPPYFKWFKGGKTNIIYNCLDLNLKERKNKLAFIWEPESLEERPRYYTYYELFKEVNRLANALKKMGIKRGDRVGIYLPMIPEVIISMLACARLGAIHSVVFSAFSSQALKVRLQDTEAKLLITADGYFRRGQLINLKSFADEGVEETKIEKIIVVKRANNEINWNSKRDYWYDELIAQENDFCPPERMDAEDPLFILYTSGSTGKPKGCLHTCGGYAVQAKFTGKWIFDFQEDDIFWSTADIGWITGHTYSCYSPLLNGLTFLIFEGAPDWPHPDRWAQIIEKYGITIFYTAPTAIRMFEKTDVGVKEKYQFKTLRILGSVGEPIDKDAWEWYFTYIGKKRCPLVDTWWQTETGGILISSLPGVGPFKPSFAGLPFPGVKFEILDDQGKKCAPFQPGNLTILPPFSPGLLRGIYKNEEKYLETYWSAYGKNIYFTSDAAYRDENGLIRILGRVDDVIKTAGHRLSTGEMENIISLHKDITECAVVGKPDEIKGEVPVVFVVSKTKRKTEELKQEVIDLIKKEIGPIALPKEVYLADDLPKTRSGKIMRRILKRLFTGEELGDLSTLSNPEAVEKIKKTISK